MKTASIHFGVARRFARAAAATFVAMLALMSGTARAQEHLILPLVPDHVYLFPAGLSVRQGDHVAIEAPALFFDGPVARPIALVARGVVGAGGAGGGIGLAMNTLPRCPEAEMCWRDDDDFFIGPFVSLEARIERTYLWTSWPRATYAGPQFSFSVYVLKVSLGWMFDVTDRTNNHPQLGVGCGF